MASIDAISFECDVCGSMAKQVMFVKYHSNIIHCGPNKSISFYCGANATVLHVMFGPQANDLLLTRQFGGPLLSAPWPCKVTFSVNYDI